MAEKLNAFYKLKKAAILLKITIELKEIFQSVYKALVDACQPALKQLLPGKQFAIMTGARFRSAGIALMIEGNPGRKFQLNRKTYAPVPFESKFSSRA